jgi:2-dehydropantoate 2-reductase
MSEIDAINGAIPPAAEAVGLKAPYNETISALVRAGERKMGVRSPSSDRR